MRAGLTNPVGRGMGLTIDGTNTAASHMPGLRILSVVEQNSNPTDTLGRGGLILGHAICRNLRDRADTAILDRGGIGWAIAVILCVDDWREGDKEQ